VVNGPDGQPIPGLAATYWYAIDRKTTEEIPNFTDNTGVDDNRQGLVIGFPIGTEQRTYQGWSDDLQALVPVDFVAVEDHEGISTYHFHSASDPAPLKDPAVLAMFPASLPKAALTGLAPALNLPPEMLQGLAALLPLLPDPVPLGYLYGYETDYWVEPTTGVLIDYMKDEARYIALGSGQVEVFHMVYQATDESIADAKEDADGPKMLLDLFGWLPWVVVGLGGLVALGGIMMLAGKRKPKPAAAS
jgi:Porin PorA